MAAPWRPAVALVQQVTRGPVWSWPRWRAIPRYLTAFPALPALDPAQGEPRSAEAHWPIRHDADLSRPRLAPAQGGSLMLCRPAPARAIDLDLDTGPTYAIEVRDADSGTVGAAGLIATAALPGAVATIGLRLPGETAMRVGAITIRDANAEPYGEARRFPPAFVIHRVRLRQDD